MKVFLIGETGQVGSEIAKLCVEEKIKTISFSSAQLDISNEVSLHSKESYFKEADVIINAAAYTNVDLAEQEKELAYKINSDGPRNISHICKKFNIPLIQISTDYVFSGEKKIQLENDEVSPLSIYGKSKASGETQISNLISNFVNVRVSWVFGKTGKNFVKTILRLANEKEELKIINDQIGCPTPALQIAQVLVNIAKSIKTNPRRGHYHYCGLESVSWYEFAIKIIEIAKKYKTLKVKNIHPIKSYEYPSPVLRPSSSILSCKKIFEDFNVKQKSWVPDLENLIKEIIEA